MLGNCSAGGGVVSVRNEWQQGGADGACAIKCLQKRTGFMQDFTLEVSTEAQGGDADIDVGQCRIKIGDMPGNLQAFYCQFVDGIAHGASNQAADQVWPCLSKERKEDCCDVFSSIQIGGMGEMPNEGDNGRAAFIAVGSCCVARRNSSRDCSDGGGQDRALQDCDFK